MFKVLFFCLIVKNENDERWQSLKSTYSKKNTNRKIRCSTLQTQNQKKKTTQKIQQLWAINEYQKTAYPSRAHTHTRRWRERAKEVNQTVKNKVAKVNARERESWQPLSRRRPNPANKCKQNRTPSQTPVIKEQTRMFCRVTITALSRLYRITHPPVSARARARERLQARCTVVGRA